MDDASAAQLPADTPNALSALGDQESFIDETELDPESVETYGSLDETVLELESIEQE